MDTENKRYILDMLNEWWNNEDIPEDMLKARIVLIYKQGDTNKYGNYIPISLLNSMYKLFAAVIQKRLASKLDRHLQKTQYGFRANRSTSDALYNIRRIMEYGEKTTNPLMLVLLDWEKAFDKVDRAGMMEALTRMGVHDKIVRIIKTLYRKC